MKDLNQYISKLSYRFSFDAAQYTKDEGWGREKLALVAIFDVPVAVGWRPRGRREASC